ncbi:CHASE3 domain-containing protein [Ferruginibacter paludis]|uniref:ATP-binding protein n=1 Tax=Ferruginibacter paludis TaxID=1310417 RepID=UPI0025B47F9F|nr:ATP-binding protein [Ferruginibacter paludis]MDN3658866.1 CHASE3 domain-containing protein [Ferruginibacter paludis]
MKQTTNITRADGIVIHLEDLISGIKDAEAGLRNYFITKDDRFLAPYHGSLQQVENSFLLLKASFSNLPGKQQKLLQLKSLSDRKYQYLSNELQYFLKHDSFINDSLIAIGYEGKPLMDSISQIVRSMEADEKNQLVEKAANIDNRYHTLNVFIVISAILALLFALLGLLTYTREKKARQASDQQVIEFQKQLELKINDLANANKELIQMRRIEKFAATGRIARNIAHEVRNPLTNINLAIAQLKSELPDTDENAALLFDMVNRNSQRINQLITELLNATRFAELNYQPVLMSVLLDEALELAKDRIVLKQVKIEKYYSTNQFTISADKEKMKIALLNIIVNAVEATEAKTGIVKISTKREDDKCLIEIADNGIGMDALALSKLFEPYFTTKQKGNGLGLTNTQNIILNHKGSIQVDSAPGNGTLFSLRFEILN